MWSIEYTDLVPCANPFAGLVPTFSTFNVSLWIRSLAHIRNTESRDQTGNETLKIGPNR